MPTKDNTARNQETPYPPGVRRAYIPPDLTYETMSDLGRELFDLSREIEEAGEGIQNEEEFERELARRKGGYIPDDDE